RIEHHLHHVRIYERGLVADRVRRRGDARQALAHERRSDLLDQARLDQRLVALDVDHDFLRPQTESRGRLRDTVRARWMAWARHERAVPVPLDRLPDA